MSIFSGRRQIALLVIDMQVNVVAKAWRRAEVIVAIQRLIRKAREAGAPVIWVRHHNAELQPGQPGWQIAPELRPEPDEPVIDKGYNDAFAETSLDRLLAGRDASGVVICGAQTDACIRATLHGALNLGFDVWLAADAHTTDDMTFYGAPAPELVIAHTNLTWPFNRLPGRVARSNTVDEISF